MNVWLLLACILTVSVVCVRAVGIPAASYLAVKRARERNANPPPTRATTTTTRRITRFSSVCNHQDSVKDFDKYKSRCDDLMNTKCAHAPTGNELDECLIKALKELDYHPTVQRSLVWNEAKKKYVFQ